MDTQVAETQSMVCCLVSCFRFPGAVLVWLVLLHSILCSFSLSLNGLLMDTSFGCTGDVRPPGRKEQSAKGYYESIVETWNNDKVRVSSSVDFRVLLIYVYDNYPTQVVSFCHIHFLPRLEQANYVAFSCYDVSVISTFSRGLHWREALVCYSSP